jgi:putative salt-induced outer membrane protein
MERQMSIRTVTVLVILLAVASLAHAQTPAPPPPPPPPPLWDVQVGASFVGTSGNSETSSAGADFAYHFRGPVWQVDSNASLVRTTDHGVDTAERYLAGIRGQRVLTTRIKLTAGERAEHDHFSGIDFRNVLDGGLTWALVHEPRWTLDGTTAIGWSHEEPTFGPARNDTVGVLQALSRIPFGTAGDTTQRLTFYPNFTDGSNYRTEAEVTAQAALNTRLALRVGYLLRYSNEPVLGFKKTDTMATASIVIRWRASTPAPGAVPAKP